MLIDYLILCHKCPEQVQQLVDALSLDEDAHAFVHVDAGSSFDTTALNGARMHICDKRIRVSWGTFSMIEATRALVSEARRVRKADYYVLLSGQDFPIKHPLQIKDFLEQHDGSNFIDIEDKGNPLYRCHMKRYEVPFHSLMMGKSTAARAIKKLYIYATGGFNKTFLPRKTPFEQLSIGSQWWALNDDFIAYAEDYLASHADYEAFYRSALVPDESFYQTLVMNSPYAETVMPSITFVNWGNGRNSPEVLTRGDFDELVGLDKKYLARKFDYRDSATLISSLLSWYGSAYETGRSRQSEGR